MCVHRVVHKSGALQTRQLFCMISLVLFIVTALVIVWPVDLPKQTDEVASAACRVTAKDAISSSSRREEEEEGSDRAFALTAVEERPADKDYSTVRSSWLAKVARPKPLQGSDYTR